MSNTPTTRSDSSTRADSATPTTSNPSKKSRKCGNCKVAVKAGDQALLCEYCSLWFHDTCEGVDQNKYDAIANSGEQTHWFCRICNLKIMDTLRFIQTVKDDNEIIKTELATIKTQVNDMSIKFDSEIKTRPSYMDVDAMIGERLASNVTHNHSTVNNVLAEIDQRSRRANNIIIHGVAESTSENREDRIKHDTQVISDIFKICEVKCDVMTVTKVIRAGAFDKDKRKRPIIATLGRPETKGELFRNAGKLRESSHKDTRISNDLTLTERENEKKLYEQAKKMTEESGDQFKVRGPPWARKITKLPPAEVLEPAAKS